MTGFTLDLGLLGPKRLELLHEIAPKVQRIAVVANPTNPHTESHTQAVKSAAVTLGLQIQVMSAGTPAELDATFDSMPKQGVGAFLVSDDPFFRIARTHILDLAVRYRLPAMYFDRQFPVAGGLISYGPDLLNLYREVGTYSGRILQGEKPANLPVVLPTAIDLVLNLKTAKALGLTIPNTILLRANEVIQ